MVFLDDLNKILDDLSEEIYCDLENIVNTNSFTTNIEGNDKVAQMLIEIGKKHDIVLEKVYSDKKLRTHLMFNQDLESDYYAIIGHFDTVHPPQSGFDKLIQKDEFLIGPGVNDMKSGVIVALYSLVVLKKIFPNKKIPIKLLFNSDEEIGSSDSKQIIQTKLNKAIGGFVFEPGRIKEKAIVTSRKGICNFHVKVDGKPAHSGVAPWEGANAIVACAKIIQEFNSLNDFEKGLSVGSNEIKGGIATNIIAPNCEFKVDVRYVCESDGNALISKMCDILKRDFGKDIKINYEILHKRAPFEESEESLKLYQLYKKSSEFFNVTCNKISTGGASDANFLSEMKIPAIDGLGGIGNYSHTQKEFILKDSVIDKIKIFTYFFKDFIK